MSRRHRTRDASVGGRAWLERLSPARLLLALTRRAVRRPRVTLAAALLLAALGVVAAARLEVKTSNLDLVDSALPPVADFRAFAREFGTPNSLVIVLDGERERIAAAADRLGPRLRAVPGVSRVLARVPISPALARLAGVDRYFRSQDGRQLYVFVQPTDPDSRAATLAPFVRAVRVAMERADLEREGVAVGYTGLPQYALDDQGQVARDLRKLSALSFAVVLALFVTAFASLRRPLLAMLALSLAMAAVLGLAALWPGHLTLVSAFFASILLGLGVDYGIHLVDRVEEIAEGDEAASSDRGNEGAAAVAAMAALAPGLATGGLTTSLAFFALLLSGFRGFAELGWIAGLGVLVCLLATATVLPALLVLIPSRRRRARPARRRLGPALARLGRPALAVPMAACALLAPLAGLPPFDSDYLDLQPRDSAAVRLERAMVRGSRWSPQFAAFVAVAREDAERLATTLYREPLVGQVRSLADLDLLGEADSREVADLRAGFVSPSGKHAVYAYPEGNVWDPAQQERFVRRMQAIDSHVTGMPVLGRFMVERSRRALVQAGSAAAVLLVLIVLADLRHPGWAALALLPTVLGVPAMLGVMRLLGASFNPIAVMALPVVLGTAEDYGVHLVHRYRQERGDLARSLAGTGRSILLTGSTTLAGFGALGLASHRGLASFGIVLALGVGCALLLSLLVLPWVLARVGPRLLAAETVSEVNGSALLPEVP